MRKVEGMNSLYIYSLYLAFPWGCKYLGSLTTEIISGITIDWKSRVVKKYFWNHF